MLTPGRSRLVDVGDRLQTAPTDDLALSVEPAPK
jgi:hypothetical protein